MKKMCEMCKRIHWKKVFIAGVIYLPIAFITRQIEAALTMKYYLMPEYFPVWSKLMMPKAGPPPASFLLTSLTFSFITGVVLAAFYDLIKEILPKGRWVRICSFTATVVLLGIVFFTLPTYLLINLPFGLLVWWIISTGAIIFLATAAFEKVLK